jgi:hypothetical protein
MNVRLPFVILLALASAAPLCAGNKKNEPKRGMLEKMEAVPCGAKQKGLSGLGSFWASAGVTHINSDEKLCPQYLLRTDDMDYQIRPDDLKHPIVLPVGHEAVFRISKNRMILSIPEDGGPKGLNYEVVAMNPVNADNPDAQKSSDVDDHDKSSDASSSVPSNQP